MYVLFSLSGEAIATVCNNIVLYQWHTYLLIKLVLTHAKKNSVLKKTVFQLIVGGVNRYWHP